MSAVPAGPEVQHFFAPIFASPGRMRYAWERVEKSLQFAHFGAMIYVEK